MAPDVWLIIPVVTFLDTWRSFDAAPEREMYGIL